MITEWGQEQGAEVHFGEGGTFEHRGAGGVVQSRIDFAVSSPDCRWVGEVDDWLLSNRTPSVGPGWWARLGGSNGERSLTETSLL